MASTDLKGITRKPKILFATIAAGGAHVASAEAMKQALEAHYPNCFELEVKEIMKDYGFATFDARHKRLWAWMLGHPKLVVGGQKIIDSLPRLSVSLQRRMLNSFSKKAATLLNSNPPDLIVANHGWLSSALTVSQRKYGLKVPVLTFQTSTLDATALWADPDIERMILGSQVAKDILIHLGVSGDKIDVVGYPIKQSFLHLSSQEEARAKLGLQEVFTCLISLGGEGVGGSPRDAVSTLRALDFPVQIVVISGRNEALKKELNDLYRNDPLVSVKGFVTNMADYVTASNVVIGKSGAAAVFEVLAVGRPFLATKKSGGIENVILGFLTANNLGAYVPTKKALQGAVTTYYKDPSQHKHVAQTSAQFDFSEMTRRVAAYLAHYAQHGTPDLSLVGKGINWVR